MAQKINCKDYSIFINEKSALNDCVRQINPSSIFILSDENTAQFCLHQIYETADFDFQTITIKAGELNKTVDTAAYVWKKLMQKGADRKSLLINLGGGMVGDLGGFCASCYMRGIDFIQMPTSLLAQVDAAVGGKTGIDIDHIKNVVGSFQMPKAVIINTSFLSSLPYKELLSGYAEMLKHGLIANESIWQRLSGQTDIASINFEEEIVQSIKIKQNIVDQDPKESGLRKILNFGHTIGHALESANLGTESHLLHGEAIAIGMVAEAHLSKQQGLISASDYQSIKSSIKTLYGNRYKSVSSAEHLMPFMLKDKKNHLGDVKFVLLQSMGNAVYDIEATSEEIELAIEDYCV